jgi:hypothetical protein
MSFIEALANLAALPSRGAYFCFAPLNIARGTDRYRGAGLGAGQL